MDSVIKPGADWQAVDAGYGDNRYETAEGIAKITICRPEVRNAFRPRTLFELRDAFELARDDPTVGVIVLTGAGSEAFCSGGDQRVRGDDGYRDEHTTFVYVFNPAGDLTKTLLASSALGDDLLEAVREAREVAQR